MVSWLRRHLLYSCVVAFLLHRSSSFCPVPKRSQAPSFASSLHAEFVDNVSLENWAVFLSSSLNLGGKPGFTVITGETGSGKSMIVKALEYCVGKKKAVPLHLFSQPTSLSASSSTSSVSYPVISTRVDVTMKPNALGSGSCEDDGLRSDRVYSRVATASCSSNYSET